MNRPTLEELRLSRLHLDRFLAVYMDGVEQVVTEIRALACPRRFGGPIVRAGFFDLPSARAEFTKAVGSLLNNEAGQPEGVFITLNPLTTDLMARANNNLKDVQGKKSINATDDHVLARHHLVIDVDPSRLSGICATEEEKAAAKLMFDGIRDEMRTKLGFGEPVVVADSGNGYHGWYRIDLPADDGGRVERILKWLASRHDTATVTLDTSMFNPSRITKLPGTWNRKGDDTPKYGRVHRMVTVLETPCAPTSSPPS